MPTNCQTYEVGCASPQVFSSNRDLCPRYPLIWRDACHQGRWSRSRHHAGHAGGGNGTPRSPTCRQAGTDPALKQEIPGRGRPAFSALTSAAGAPKASIRRAVERRTPDGRGLGAGWGRELGDRRERRTRPRLRPSGAPG